jgi:hypothetical protein
MLAIWF